MQLKQVRTPGVHIWLLHLEHLVETLAPERLPWVTVKLTNVIQEHTSGGTQPREGGVGGEKVWRREKREGKMG